MTLLETVGAISLWVLGTYIGANLIILISGACDRKNGGLAGTIVGLYIAGAFVVVSVIVGLILLGKGLA